MAESSLTSCMLALLSGNHNNIIIHIHEESKRDHVTSKEAKELKLFVFVYIVLLLLLYLKLCHAICYEKCVRFF